MSSNPVDDLTELPDETPPQDEVGAGGENSPDENDWREDGA